MHGFKVEWYLKVGNETRRLMWRLAHAHGVLLALVHIAFAVTVKLVESPPERWRFPSRCLTLAGFLLPGGFFLGGVLIYSGDPWIGVLLVPVGALCLFLGVLATGREVRRR